MKGTNLVGVSYMTVGIRLRYLFVCIYKYLCLARHCAYTLGSLTEHQGSMIASYNYSAESAVQCSPFPTSPFSLGFHVG